MNGPITILNKKTKTVTLITLRNNSDTNAINPSKVTLSLNRTVRGVYENQVCILQFWVK